jgi:hypothetical protein
MGSSRRWNSGCGEKDACPHWYLVSQGVTWCIYVVGLLEGKLGNTVMKIVDYKRLKQKRNLPKVVSLKARLDAKMFQALPHKQKLYDAPAPLKRKIEKTQGRLERLMIKITKIQARRVPIISEMESLQAQLDDEQRWTLAAMDQAYDRDDIWGADRLLEESFMRAEPMRLGIERLKMQLQEMDDETRWPEHLLRRQTLEAQLILLEELLRKKQREA